MYESRFASGFHSILMGLMLILFPTLVPYLLSTVDTNNEALKTLDTYESNGISAELIVKGNEVNSASDILMSVLDGVGTMTRIVGIFLIIYGASNVVLGYRDDYSYSPLSVYNSCANSLVFWVLEIGDKKFKNIDVKLENLSKSTIQILRNKIETPLKSLYETASKSKRAKEEYSKCSVYITTLAEDLNKAISQCENDLMEKKLIEKLYIIENTIEIVKDKVNAAIQTDRDEERYLKELKVESFEPFTTTECINQLEENYNISNPNSIITNSENTSSEEKINEFLLDMKDDGFDESRKEYNQVLKDNNVWMSW